MDEATPAVPAKRQRRSQSRKDETVPAAVADTSLQGACAAPHLAAASAAAAAAAATCSRDGAASAASLTVASGRAKRKVSGQVRYREDAGDSSAGEQQDDCDYNRDPDAGAESDEEVSRTKKKKQRMSAPAQRARKKSSKQQTSDSAVLAAKIPVRLQRKWNRELLERAKDWEWAPMLQQSATANGWQMSEPLENVAAGSILCSMPMGTGVTHAGAGSFRLSAELMQRTMEALQPKEAATEMLVPSGATV